MRQIGNKLGGASVEKVMKNEIWHPDWTGTPDLSINLKWKVLPFGQLASQPSVLGELGSNCGINSISLVNVIITLTSHW